MDSAQTLGECLRNEREKRGITIEQVASATKINVRMLHALEADHFAELPAKPFVRGFVTSYCRFVGLPPREVLTRFNKFIEERAQSRPNRDAGHSGYAFEKREGEQSRTVLWFVMGSFITIGAVLVVFLKPSLHHHHSTHVEKLRNAHGTPGPEGSPEPTPSGGVAAAPGTGAVGAIPGVVASPTATSAIPGATESAIPAPKIELTGPPAPSTPETPVAASTVAVTDPLVPPVASAPSPTPTPTPSASPEFRVEDEPASDQDPLNSGVTTPRSEIKHKAVFKAHTDVWVRYRVDGKPPMHFILRKDRILVLRARQVIRFQTSEPKQVTFTYNGSASKFVAAKSPDTPQDKDITLVFPSEVSKMIKDPFPAERTLRGRFVPAPRATPAISTPGE